MTVVPGTRTEACLSSSSLTTFTGTALPIPSAGTYTLYRHPAALQEVQVTYRRCNLRALCVCSVAVRIRDVIIAFDICSKGDLQVWSAGPGRHVPEGARLLSLDEGRAYRVLLPTGTSVTLGPYLSTIRVEASTTDKGVTEGICGAFGRQPRALTDLAGWRVIPDQSLFTGQLPPPGNNTSPPLVAARGCPCRQHSSNEVAAPSHTRLCSPDEGCQDPRAVSIMERVLEQGALGADIPTLATLAGAGEEVEGAQVATVKVAGGPVLPRPHDSWTLESAGKFCTEFLGAAPAVAACRAVPGVAVEERVVACGEDVLVSGVVGVTEVTRVTG